MAVLPFKIPHSDGVSGSCVEEGASGVQRDLVDLVLSRRDRDGPAGTG